MTFKHFALSLQDWRTAMDPRSSAPAYAIHRSTERGLATATETWATPDGASYRRRVTRERDGEEWPVR